jgi:hypothetical protein
VASSPDVLWSGYGGKEDRRHIGTLALSLETPEYVVNHESPAELQKTGPRPLELRRRGRIPQADWGATPWQGRTRQLVDQNSGLGDRRKPPGIVWDQTQEEARPARR